MASVPGFQVAAISYDAVEGATAYKVEYRSDGASEWTVVGISLVTPIQHLLSQNFTKNIRFILIYPHIL